MKISIIMPIYNSEKYLERCLRSIVNQTYNNFEVICINDGSTDRSKEILEKFAIHYEYIKIFNQTNKGTGFARNLGIEYSSGDYICFVDPDDYIDSNYIKIITETIEKNNFDVILFNPIIAEDGHLKYYNFSEKVNFFTKKNILKELFCYKDFNLNVLQIIPQWSFVYVCDKNFIKNNNIYFSESTISEDTIFSLKILFLSNKILYLNKYLYYYIKRINSYSNCMNYYHSKDIFIMYNDVRRFFLEKNYYNSSDLYKIISDYLVCRISRHYHRIPIKNRKWYMDYCSKIFNRNEYRSFINYISKDCFISKILFFIKINIIYTIIAIVYNIISSIDKYKKLIISNICYVVIKSLLKL